MKYFQPYITTMKVCAKQVFDGGLAGMTGDYLIRFGQFIFLVMIWKGMAAAGAGFGDMNLEQMLTYSLMSTVFWQQFNILTPATSALWEGSIISRFTRPVPVQGSLIAETVGKWWIPVFLCYSIPLLLLSPLLDISLWPKSITHGLLALISLCFSIIIGFSVDFLFASLAMNMKNGCWAAIQIREAVFNLMSGAVIPLALFPWKLGQFFEWLPLGSIASAPLSIYIGSAGSAGMMAVILLRQAVWSIVLWVLAGRIFKKSEERMTSYGG